MFKRPDSGVAPRDHADESVPLAEAVVNQIRPENVVHPRVMGGELERKHAFAPSVGDHAVATADVPDENARVVFTERTGEVMMGVDRVGGK